MYTKQEIIIRSYREGNSQRQIARELHISRKTVRKYIFDYESDMASSGNKESILSKYLSKPIVYKSGPRVKLKLTREVQAAIDKLLEENRLKLRQGLRKQVLKKIDIQEALHGMGYQIGYTTVCNYIREKEGKISNKEAFIRQEYLPGTSCEFDWGEIKLIIAGQQVRLNLAVFTSAYSNYRYALIYRRQDTLAFLESHVSFFAHTGGVYHEMVYDNMRVAVAKFVGLHEKEPTQALLQLRGHYQFLHRFCNAYRGNEKGHVERSVEYIRRKAFGVKSSFENQEEATAYLCAVVERLNSTRQQLTGKTAMEMFATEKKELWQITGPLACSESAQLRTDKYATVSYRCNRYSVPDSLVGHFVDAKVFSHKIEFYHNNKLVASHARDYGNHQWVIDIEHYLHTFNKKPGALKGSVALARSSYLKQLYQQFYLNRPRDFIDLLHYCHRHRVSGERLETAVSRIAGTCPLGVDTEKITAILGNKITPQEILPVNTTETMGMAKKQLQQVADLFS